MAENSSKANLIARILFIIGGVILFILLAIFIIRLVPAAISGIANIGSSLTSGLNTAVTGDDIVVTTNTDSVTNGAPVVFNFQYAPSVPGQYFVTYECSDGLFYDILSANGPRRIICNTPFKLGENLTGISLVPIVTRPNTFIDSTVTIEYKDMQNNPIAKGSKLVTIKSETVDGQPTGENPFNSNGTLTGSTVTTTEVKPTTPPAPKPTTTPAPRPTPKPVAPVTPTRDLAITQIFRGTTDSSFVFHVYNYGNTATGPWEFTYTDAENPSTIKVSPTQPSLGAGQGLAVTVRFDGQKNPSQVITVIVDPYNRIPETTTANNTASITITGTQYGGGAYDPQARADLAITEMEVGRISGGRFVATSRINENDTSAVRIIVKNQGGKSTGAWRFRIDNLPYNKDDTYRSGTYQSLQPGQSIEIIAEFTGINQGQYSIRVEVDPENDVVEENESNNTRTRLLEVVR